MKKEEIFKKAIKKAKTNGYNKAYIGVGGIYITPKSLEYTLDLSIAEIYSIIFSHDFAKALWSEEIKCNTCDLEQKKHKITESGHFYECSNCGVLVEGEYCDESWKNHLSKMVLEKDPLKYIEKFLN